MGEKVRDRDAAELRAEAEAELAECTLIVRTLVLLDRMAQRSQDEAEWAAIVRVQKGWRAVLQGKAN